MNVRSTSPQTPKSQPDFYDLVIIGAGPAGLKMGFLAEQHGLRYCILEQQNIGESWRRMSEQLVLLSLGIPRADMTSLTPNFPIWLHHRIKLFPTRNQFIAYLQEFAGTFRLNIRDHTKVESLSWNDNQFHVVTAGHSYQAATLVIATGTFQNPFLPDIPGIQNNPAVWHSSDRMHRESCDQGTVLVVGAGNSAAELAIDLADRCHVTLAANQELQYFINTGSYNHIHPVNQAKLQELQLFNVINIIENIAVENIHNTLVTFNNGISRQYHNIVFATGFRSCHPSAPGMPIKRDEFHSPILTTKKESVSVPNLFYAGAIAATRPREHFIHHFRDLLENTFYLLHDRLEPE